MTGTHWSAARQREERSSKVKNRVSRQSTTHTTDPLNRSFGERHRAENPPGARAALHSRRRHPRIVCCGRRRRRQVDRLQRAVYVSPLRLPTILSFSLFVVVLCVSVARARAGRTKRPDIYGSHSRSRLIRGCAVNLFDIYFRITGSVSRCTSLTNLRMPPDASCMTANVNRRHWTQNERTDGRTLISMLALLLPRGATVQ